MPGVSSSGNCNPPSMMRISSLYSKNIILRPISSKPPRATQRTVSLSNGLSEKFLATANPPDSFLIGLLVLSVLFVLIILNIYFVFLIIVGRKGVEPLRPCGHRLLGPTCLPFHHLPLL